MTSIERDLLTREFFGFEVRFENGKFGKSARWDNNFHPDNPNFMQNVNWVVYENGDKSKVIVNFYLDKTNSGNNYTYKVLDYVDSFEHIVFNVWKGQLKKL